MIQLPGRDARSRFGLPGALGKRAVSRLIRFAVHHQETINERFVSAIGDVRTAIVALEQQTSAGRDGLEHQVAGARAALEQQIDAGREALAALSVRIDAALDDVRARTTDGDAERSSIAVLRREIASERTLQRKLSFSQTLLEERVARIAESEDERRAGAGRDADGARVAYAALTAKVTEAERKLGGVSEAATASAAGVVRLQQTLAASTALLRELGARQEASERRLDAAARETDAVRKALASAGARFDELERRLEDARTARGEDGARIADILGAIDVLSIASQEMAALVDTIARDHAASIEAAAAQTSAAHAAVAETNAAIASLVNGPATVYANGSNGASSNGAAAHEAMAGAFDARMNATPYMARDVFGAAAGLEVRREASGFDYLGFEEIFRGPEAFIKERQHPYVQFFAPGSRVLDAGCGRGEMLELLSDAGVDAVGVDVNAAMVARCRSKGFDNVVHADVLAYLDAEPAESFDAIFSAQVIEHLGFDALYGFCERALRSLKPNGVFVAETVNPNCFEALKTFHVDPTHHNPLFPETMRFLCRSAGFRDARIFYPTGAGFAELEPHLRGEYAVVAWK